MSSINNSPNNNAIESGGLLDSYGRPAGRRKFMATSITAVAGFALSIREADAGLFGYSSKPVAGIPSSWVRKKGTNVYRYANFIKSLGLRNITPRMVLAPHFNVRGYTSNSLPPKSQWKKMAPTLKIIDRMAREMGRPVDCVLSAYRSPRYNRAVGGKSRSLHMQNQAVDVRFHGASPRHVASVARYLRKKRKFSGGVGRYSSFVHVDTRGYNADW